jgi:hypothetical protein
LVGSIVPLYCVCAISGSVALERKREKRSVVVRLIGM